ncbi:MAG TPA: DUF5678 domain-containing protein [Blastocatellia bacterium]|nr:DUF5678 domain-containing protein [Blastocatellia bacterium]
MAQTNAELILAQIAALPPEEREKLIELLNRRLSATQDETQPSVFIQPFDSRDPTPSLRWIEEHRAEFAGQYVALDGDRLVAHGTDPQEIIAAVRASGLNGLFFTLIPPADAPPFAGF